MRGMPSLQFWKARGVYRVRLGGRDHYLGSNRREAQRLYSELVAAWVASGRPTHTPGESQILTVRSLAEWLAAEYGVGSRGHSEAQSVLARLGDFGEALATFVTPFALRDWAAKQSGWSRVMQNRAIAFIKRAYRRAANSGKIPASVAQQIAVTESLRAGEGGGESRKVKPVSLEVVQATLAHCSEVIADTARVQLACGCRPGEVVRLAWTDIDTSSTPWEWVLDEHKNAHRDQERVIFLGPDARSVLMKYLGEPRPFERRPNAYTTAIRKAAKRAGITPWAPNQLRHTAATLARQREGVETAGSVLGHADIDTTMIYAERSKDTARRYIEIHG